MSLLRRSWNSLHARLLIGAAIWVCAALMASDVALGALFRQHVSQQFLHELVDHLTELRGLTHADDDGTVHLIRPVSDPRFVVEGSGFYWQVSEAGRPLLKSPSLGADMITLPSGEEGGDSHVARLRDGPQSLLVEARDVTLKGRTLHFAVGADGRQLERVLAQFTRLLHIFLAVLALGLIAAAAGQVAIGLLPLRRLRGRLAEVREGKSERVSDDFPSEVRPLVSDLNGMLAANEEMLRRARSQAGNLAHALKGPLAILTDEAERLAAAGKTETAAVVLEQCGAMSRQIDYQLARARAAASRTGPALRAAPSAATGAVISAMARLYGDRKLTFENALRAEVEAACDSQDLDEMIGNLVDNAAKWAASRIRIRYGDNSAPGMISILVEDDGPGVPPENHAAVFAVGVRLDERQPGSGLGLGIVKDLAELYGGRVSLGASDLGGLAANLELPAAP